MDANAPAFVPGGLSADAAEFVPLAGRQMAPPSLGMSSEAPEFVPGKMQGMGGMNGMPVFSINYDMANASAAGASGVRGMPSSQHSAMVASSGGYMDGVSGTGALCEVDSSQEWAAASMGNMIEGDGNWDPADDGKWDDTGPRWETEDVSKASAGMLMGSKILTADGYMGHMGDLDVNSAHVAGVNCDGVHRGENLVEVLMGGQLLPQDMSLMEPMEASNANWDISSRREHPILGASTGDAGPEVLGTKVALDVLFPNMDRRFDEDAGSRGSASLDRRHPGTVTVTARLPVAAAPDDFRDWGSSNNRFDRSPVLPYSFSQTSGVERAEQPASEDALNIAESVAAMALGFDMEDESPVERLDKRADFSNVVSPEPATASQSLAFPPPSANSGPHGSIVSLHDVLPMQDALWRPPPRIPVASVQGQLPCSGLEQEQDPLSPDEASLAAGSRNPRNLPPPPPTEPPPPPPAELMRRQLPLRCDQAVALH